MKIINYRKRLKKRPFDRELAKKLDYEEEELKSSNEKLETMIKEHKESKAEYVEEEKRAQLFSLEEEKESNTESDDPVEINNSSPVRSQPHVEDGEGSLAVDLQSLHLESQAIDIDSQGEGDGSQGTNPQQVFDPIPSTGNASGILTNPREESELSDLHQD